MRVFVTGATGALGRHLVPALVAAGHEVTATTRMPGKAGWLRQVGAEPVVVDGLDREAVIAAVQAAAPEVDRKSTRLNSSHLGISYAVFCLKKKKTQQNNELSIACTLHLYHVRRRHLKR